MLFSSTVSNLSHISLTEILTEILSTLEHARIFITSREKMHKDGVKLYDELIDRLKKSPTEAERLLAQKE